MCRLLAGRAQFDMSYIPIQNCMFHQFSILAQWVSYILQPYTPPLILTLNQKRAGLITRRTQDRNLQMLFFEKSFSSFSSQYFCCFPCICPYVLGFLHGVNILDQCPLLVFNFDYPAENSISMRHIHYMQE